MFKNIKKVDKDGKVIRGFKRWRKSHPKDIFFDSQLEWELWDFLTRNKIKLELKKTVVLMNSLKTDELKNNKIVNTTQRAITFTPDLYLPDQKVFIEIKGWATPEFKIRWKLFKQLKHVGYIVKTKEELLIVLEHLGYDTSKFKD